MYGYLGLPDCVGGAAQKVKTNSIAAFNSATSTILDHLNRVNKQNGLKVLDFIAVSLNDTRLWTRQWIQPKYRQQLHEEVFVQMLKRCLEVKRYNHELIPLRQIRCEILPNKDLQMEGMLAMVIWTFLHNAAAEVDFHVLDDKMRTWNTRIDEHNLIRKIGIPSRWNIFEADDCKYEGHSRLISDGEENSLSDSYSSDDRSTESIDKLLKSADVAVSDVTSGGGDGKSSNELSLYPTLEHCDFTAAKKKHGVLYSIRKLFKLEKNMPAPKTGNQSRSSVFDRNGCENDTSYQGPIQHTTGLSYQSRDVNDNFKYSPGQTQTDLQVATEKKIENDGLTIHIPSNVEKIVLIKDGRKITVEL